MSLQIKIFGLLASAILVIYIIDLVRKKKLREEYSFIWFVIGLSMIIFLLRFDLIMALTEFLGVLSPNNVIFFFSILFLFVIALQFSVKISNLTNQIKILAQENTLLRKKIEEIVDIGGVMLPISIDLNGKI
ncbi:small membrane protein, partial [Candidatus Hakubella thermalkaliphila]